MSKTSNYSVQLLLLLTMMMATVTSAEAQSYAPQVGKTHPDLTLPRIDTGAPVSLSQFRGRKLLLIHFASW